MVSVLQPDVRNRPGVPRPNSLERTQSGQMPQAAFPTSRQQNNPRVPHIAETGAQQGSAGSRSHADHLELTMVYFRSFLIICVLTGTPLLAQEKAAGISRNEEPVSSFQAVNASVYTILQQYEQLTGNTLIMDSNLAVNALTISISLPEPVPRSELMRIIES